MVKEAESVNWVAVESSVLAGVAYSHEERELYLEFVSGDIYCYFDFPPEQHDELLVADSKGGYFNRCIRNHFRYQQCHGWNCIAS
jgi:hypothetical protein